MIARLRFRQLRYWLWSRTREDRPSRRLDAWADRVHQINTETRQATEHAADDSNPHTPVTTVHRPAIYVDAQGRTGVRDRWGTRVLGENTDPATEMEAV